MNAMTTRWQTFAAVVKALAKHRATYKFLALLVVALGFLQGGPLIESFGSVVCILVAGGCVAD
ncbi:hypothetical protein PflCFBP13517_18400 [Pseudomonas fluorescens]|nr:hypothetical protein PflCFBP13517_18400 [Pseudomonas fluorescens]